MKDFLGAAFGVVLVFGILVACNHYWSEPEGLTKPEQAVLFVYKIEEHAQQIADGLAAGYEIRYIDGYRVVLQKPKVGKMTEVVPVPVKQKVKK